MSRISKGFLLIIVACSSIFTTACGQEPSTTTAPSSASTTAHNASDQQVDLTGVKDYLIEKTQALTSHTAQLKALGNRYYELAKASHFDYAVMWNDHQAEITQLLDESRAAWRQASPGYEQIEGIIAGVPSLAQYDVVLDSGTMGSEGGDNVVPFDLHLPDGRVLDKPGNLFGVTESTLWGTYADYTVPSVVADLNSNGTADFGEQLPEANVLKSSTETLDQYANEMLSAAEAWQPTTADAFTALVVMVPTMSEYFDSWKQSRFIAGEQSQQRDFVAISRLADIQDILSGLQVVYTGVRPLVDAVDTAQAHEIADGLNALKAFVANVYTQEQGGKRFSAEEADLLGSEAQNRATAITGQISQVAAQLSIPIQQ